MSNPTTTVPTPVRKDRRGGIKSVVGEFISAERLAVATNLQWVADNCDFPKAAIGLCYAETPVTDNKEFGGLTVGDGPIFALYAGVQCYLGNDTDYEVRARAQLEVGEGRGVEEVLWEYGTTRGGTGPAQASWIAAFGQADEAADTLYVGRPVIMISRYVAVVARARKAIFGDEEGNLWTANGTPVIASAAASDTTLVVMGWPTIYASALTSLTVPNPIINQEMALAERVYGIAVDCNFALHYDVTDPEFGGTGCVYDDVTIDQPQATFVYSRAGDQVTVKVTPKASGGNTGSVPWMPTTYVQVNNGAGSVVIMNANGTLGGGISAGGLTPFTWTYLAQPDPNCDGAPGTQSTLELQIGTQPSSPIPDGTDVTVTVQSDEPVDEVNLWYRINGGAWADNGEMTEINSQEFVENLDGTLASPGDVFDLYAKSGTTVSPTITIEVT